MDATRLQPGRHLLERPVRQQPGEQQVAGLEQREILVVLDVGGGQQRGDLHVEQRRRDDQELSRLAEVPLYDTTPIEMSLKRLGPLDVRLVRRAEGEKLFAHLLSHYHYLGYSRPVGEHLKYLVLAGARPIACLAWNSGPLKLKLRDGLVGAPRQAYAHNLHLIAYNSRYLIAPWVKVPHLASHLLGRIARRISHDWQQLYEHPIWLLESFVDIERFKGTCYRAANWQCLGPSLGRGTKSTSKQKNTSIKELWVYPLGRNFRQQLLCPP